MFFWLLYWFWVVRAPFRCKYHLRGAARKTQREWWILMGMGTWREPISGSSWKARPEGNFWNPRFTWEVGTSPGVQGVRIRNIITSFIYSERVLGHLYTCSKGCLELSFSLFHTPLVSHYIFKPFWLMTFNFLPQFQPHIPSKYFFSLPAWSVSPY